MYTLPFFRIGDKVTVKSISEITEVKGIHDMKGTYKTFTCRYKNMNYEVFSNSDEFSLQGMDGVVIGGVYDTYLQVKINDKVYLLPHFALKYA